MANTTTSTNMSMPVPVVGVDPGPQWATDINTCLGILDQHDHSSGLGVQITPAGLNISSALSMQSNFLTLCAGVTFAAQLSAPANGTVYTKGSDLYFVDGVGNDIRVTQSGSVTGSAGTITGLPSGTASASFGTGVFVFQSATNTGANIDGASFVLRNATASSNGLTLSPPNAMGANYTLTLPSLPASTKILVLDTSGNITATYDTDNVTLEVNSNNLRIKASGVNTTQLADASVTRPKMAAVGGTTSASSNSFTTSSTTYTTITGVGVTLTTSGRPVMIFCQPDGTTDGYFGVTGSNPSAPMTSATAFLEITRDGVAVFTHRLATLATNAAGNTFGSRIPPGAVQVLDGPAAGTYTWRLQVKVAGANQTVEVINLKMVAYEL